MLKSTYVCVVRKRKEILVFSVSSMDYWDNTITENKKINIILSNYSNDHFPKSYIR